MRKRYGTFQLWNIDYRGSLQNNRWYCIETYVKMNTPGRSDGVLRGWVDGYLAMESDSMEFRTSPDLRIEEYWLNFYYGGREVAPNEMYIYLDNLVLSTSRIGTALK